jgi:exodeoxyribonuclease V alpha subunit
MKTFILSTEQNAAIKHFTNNGLTVVLGSPGSGKTTLIKYLLIPNEKTLLCSPTGCAADRISNATGLIAHVISKIEFDEKLLAEFHGCNLVIDESSMVSIDGARRIISFLKPKRVCFIGDCKQLPCIEGSPVLNTLLACSDVPKIILSLNHRQKKMGALMENLMNLGGEDFSIQTDEGFKTCVCTSDKDAIQKACELFMSLQDAQMLAFTNKTCEILNDATASSKIVRVVCTKNLYENGELLVANGVTGRKISEKCVQYDNGYLDVFKTKFLTRFVPARCMSVHKSQGNEFDTHGIIVLSSWKGDNVPLELIYTAMSRFKGSVHVFGTEVMMKKAFWGSFSLNNIDEIVVAQLSKKIKVMD